MASKFLAHNVPQPHPIQLKIPGSASAHILFMWRYKHICLITHVLQGVRLVFSSVIWCLPLAHLSQPLA